MRYAEVELREKIAKIMSLIEQANIEMIEIEEKIYGHQELETISDATEKEIKALKSQVSYLNSHIKNNF